MKKNTVFLFILGSIFCQMIRVDAREIGASIKKKSLTQGIDLKSFSYDSYFCEEHQEKPPDEICQYWQSRVDPTIKNPGLQIDQKNPKNILIGIRCLLALKGKKNAARMHGATNPEVSEIFWDECPVEVAALFYASYLFYGNSDFLMAIVLIDKTGKYNTPYAIDRAYELYNIWYEKILKIGLEKARELHLNPLENSDIRWY